MHKIQQLSTDLHINWCFCEVGNFNSLIMQKHSQQDQWYCQQNHLIWPWPGLQKNTFCIYFIFTFRKVLNTLSV